MRARLTAQLQALFLLMSATAASADVPFFNASCPRHIEVHADEGGPVYVNGEEAQLHRFSSSYYEATRGRTTISIMVNPDHTLNVSYTTGGGGNGICQVNAQQRHPRDVPQATPAPSLTISMRQMPRFCAGEASSRFGVRPGYITTNSAHRIGDRYVVQGYLEGNRGTVYFNCYFDARGSFLRVD